MSALLTAAQFRALAIAQVGKTYRYGAEASYTDPDPKAFDCSELTEWLHARAGSNLGDLAASQYRKTFAVTAPAVGDLVFLANNPDRYANIGHVAVLTAPLTNGDWEVVEARGKAYGVVRTTLSYWRSRPQYAGLRRYSGFLLAVTGDIVYGIGSRGKPVEKLQASMLRFFPAYATPIKDHGGVDGIYGKATGQVVAEFQTRSKLKATGQVDTKTLALLRSKYGVQL